MYLEIAQETAIRLYSEMMHNISWVGLIATVVAVLVGRLIYWVINDPYDY